MVQDDGSRLIAFPNGTRKHISADGSSILVQFFNGDTKHIKPDGSVVSNRLNVSSPLDYLSVSLCLREGVFLC